MTQVEGSWICADGGYAETVLFGDSSSLFFRESPRGLTGVRGEAFNLGVSEKVLEDVPISFVGSPLR